MVTKTVDLSAIRDLDLDRVTVKSVNADDMMDAAARCTPPDGGQLDPNLFSMALRQQLIAQAIKDFTPRSGDNTGKVVVVQGSCQDSLNWNSRTREYVGEVFDYLNGVGQQEREDFRKALMSTGGSQSDVRAA
jgi:hypothetical protein